MITKDDLYQKTLEDFLNNTNNTKSYLFTKVFSELLSFNYIIKTIFDIGNNFLLFTFGTETNSFIENLINGL